MSMRRHTPPRATSSVRSGSPRSAADVIRRVRERAGRVSHDISQARLAMSSELDLDAVLQHVADTARTLVGARYGAISWLNDDGRIADLVTSGLSDEEVTRIGHMPQGHGLLGQVISEGQSLRLSDLTTHPGSVGMPPSHPVMHSLLAVPITTSGHVLGNLYLSEKLAGGAFTPRDEQVLRRFAAQAAVALVNARFQRQAHAAAIATERERIARELHDSLAQVLAYVMTKSQAALTHLAAGNDSAAASQIRQLHEAAHDAYSDVRENILGLRSGTSPDTDLMTALEEFVAAWQDHAGIPVTLSLPGANARRTFIRHPAAARLQMLRIVQEATTNIRKHAHASAVTISLGQHASVTELRISDNGSGFHPDLLPPSGQPRFGLATMRERAEAIGGTLAVASSPAGTAVTLRAPAAGETSA